MYDSRQSAISRKDFRRGAVDDRSSIPTGKLRKQKKRYGIKFTKQAFIGYEMREFTLWYKSERDRALALKGKRKSGYLNGEILELVER